MLPDLLSETQSIDLSLAHIEKKNLKGSAMILSKESLMNDMKTKWIMTIFTIGNFM